MSRVSFIVDLFSKATPRRPNLVKSNRKTGRRRHPEGHVGAAQRGPCGARPRRRSRGSKAKWRKMPKRVVSSRGLGIAHSNVSARVWISSGCR
jgi:hypothetical protein